MRLFLGIDLPMFVKRKLFKVSEELDGLRCVRRVRKENLHITLLFLGEKTNKEKMLIHQRLQELKFKPFKVSVEGLGFFPSEHFIRVIWAGVGEGRDKLVKLHSKIVEALDWKESEPFVPHVTLARATAKIPGLEDFKKKYEKKKFGSFVVKEFFLVRSHLGRAKARYEALECYTLE